MYADVGARHYKRLHLWVSGRVQGVWYRASCRREAESLGLTGWVRNLEDGRVEILVEGPGDSVDRLVTWCKYGPPNANVEKIDAREEVIDSALVGFRVIRE